MKLLRLERGLWDVLTPIEGKESQACPLTDFLSEIGAQYEASVDGMIDLLGRFAQSGRDSFTDALCHYVDKEEKIWEFVKGDIRVLWFYGTGGKIIVCSHGFIKKTRTTPVKQTKKAIKAKQAYEEAVANKQIEIIEDEENGD